jgi:hypothetical protein
MTYRRIEVFMAVNVKITVFWDVIDNLIDKYQCFGGTGHTRLHNIPC